MPVFDFECKKCKTVCKDVYLGFSETDKEQLCVICHKPMKKLVGGMNPVFKGSGFYVNDYGPTRRR